MVIFDSSIPMLVLLIVFVFDIKQASDENTDSRSSTSTVGDTSLQVRSCHSLPALTTETDTELAPLLQRGHDLD
ncbi:hypothetical protein J6590_097380 [Homalodisca vitripennis]|nr:hypothetical protein J6590_097380 [Homalodisca vitripennis]